MERRRFHFKVPSTLKSRKKEEKSYVEFKNLTPNLVLLYWVDYNGKAKFFAELNPIHRNDVGLRILTFVTHPWLAVYGKKQLFLNGKKYFFPPLPFWNENSNDWLNKKWHVVKVVKPNDSKSDDVKNEEKQSDEGTSSESLRKNTIKYFEVLIDGTDCMSLKTICSLKLLEYLQGNDHNELNIPKGLKKFVDDTKEKYFMYTTS